MERTNAELAKRGENLNAELKNTKRKCTKAKAILIGKTIVAGILTAAGVITGTMFPNPIAVSAVAAGAAVVAGTEASKVSYRKLRKELSEKTSKKKELVQIATQQATNKMRDDILAFSQHPSPFVSPSAPQSGGFASGSAPVGSLYPDPRI